MRTILTIIMLIMVLPMAAQEMSVENFNRQKKSLLKDVKVQKEKKNAVLLLTTDEKGFLFKADAKTDIKAEEGEGLLTLKVPHKTYWLTITHPDYGQYSWKVPGKGLRKKKIYHAYLKTYNPSKEYKLQKQWVIFHVEPQNAIVHVDSNMTIVRNGKAQFYLPVGKHSYMVESPFYETVKDTIEVVAEKGQMQVVRLQPVYSYLSVSTPDDACEIYVDNELIGKHVAVTGRMEAGIHRLTVFIDSRCYYDAPVTIGESTKMSVSLTTTDLKQRPWREQFPLAAQAAADSTRSFGTAGFSAIPEPRIQAAVSIQAADDSTEIWVDRVMMGTGSWKGMLDEGFHIINSQKNGRQSNIRYLWVKDDSPLEMNIGAPQADLGYLNIHSNVMGATVYVNDSIMGTTPCVIGDLPVGRTYTIRLVHQFYEPVAQQVIVLGNDLVNVEMTMRRIW